MGREREWVKLYGQSIDTPVFRNEGLWKVWTWCLMKAVHEKCIKSPRHIKNTKLKNANVELSPGQFIYGRNLAAIELDMGASGLRYRIERLTELGMIKVDSTIQYSIITIINWENYI
jgi:hypothetical protein